MASIVLHQWEISPFCGKARKILKRKGLSYSVVNYNGLLARRAAGLSAVGKLPVLEYGDKRIQDSSDIAAFLEREIPEPPLLPSDPQERALALLWEDWADESLFWFEVHFRMAYPEALAKSAALLCEGRPRFEEWLMRQVLPRMYGKRLVAQGLGRMDAVRVEGRFRDHLSMLEAILENRPWLAGSEQTIGDLAVAAQLDEVVRTGHVREEILGRPSIRDWLDRT